MDGRVKEGEIRPLQPGDLSVSITGEDFEAHTVCVCLYLHMQKKKKERKENKKRTSVCVEMMHVFPSPSSLLSSRHSTFSHSPFISIGEDLRIGLESRGSCLD